MVMLYPEKGAHPNYIAREIFFAGREHEMQQKALAKHFGLAENEHNQILFNESVYSNLHMDGRKQFHPIAMEGTGPLYEKSEHRTDYSAFESFEEAVHQLIRDLVRWQKISIDLVDPARRVRKIILVGGFSKSKLFIEILKRETPERQIMLSDHPRASALGAAWLVNEERTYRQALSNIQLTKA